MKAVNSRGDKVDILPAITIEPHLELNALFLDDWLSHSNSALAHVLIALVRLRDSGHLRMQSYNTIPYDVFERAMALDNDSIDFKECLNLAALGTLWECTDQEDIRYLNFWSDHLKVEQSKSISFTPADVISHIKEIDVVMLHNLVGL